MENGQLLRNLVPIYPRSGHHNSHSHFLGYLLYSKQKHAYLVACRKLDPAQKKSWVSYAGAAHRFDSRVMAQTAQHLIKKGSEVMELYEKEGKLVIRRAV
ncbi:hypothetical protein Y5S_00412 [Alcanivorax nanhaiticus]|uniref:Uncharacterized protein n=1 Tax=Alcanivorax nanhaiticus TaxID=1177154 RepID=A0A095UW06_9GAMM|nr:hypothetical protein [Alcanivorax nanhaiticus]KGD66745.1 hypothetical protein Y5S_00412 [Alcanivorax nanhaiticus]